MEEDPLEQTRFTYQESKDGSVHIAFMGRTIKHLGAIEAVKFLNRMDGADPRGQQLIMAKATGHFKHGNERSQKQERHD